MPDGRVVPVCVVKAALEEQIVSEINEESITYPENLIGGSYPVIAQVQQQHLASLGCLVTDGHL